jgi:hypothetical protein
MLAIIAVSSFLSIILNIIAMMIELHHFSEFYDDKFSENIYKILFYMANWPSLLLSLYPYADSLDGSIVYEIFGWFTFNVLFVNILGWGCLVLFYCRIRVYFQKKIKNL